MDESAPGFYGSYASYKGYVTPALGTKQMRRFDALVWDPGECRADMRFLEIGCGTGAFLAYLAAKGCGEFLGIDHDPALAAVIPETARDRFRCQDLRQALSQAGPGSLDRVVALDVLEHFTPDEALDLVAAVAGALAPGGRMIVKVPNAACPWGLQYQFGDLTHRTAFTPLSLRQLADAAGLRMIAARPVRQGSRRRLFTDALVHRFLSWALLTPPEIWTANLVAVFEAGE
ncbi:cyclopropane-fatty-acyl-phospholipid synthase family protein [Magnetospirillum sp. UT-4]|uniref:SAM-dependent methyltransferase n=1 Tax=Magnetospirillum sp. UT-4 TaxID=2681467 RepID=UPI0013845EA7|nr:class I SAM-dependent methyltransferase [Magnetospirillum sp. UT-4]CAA7611666.1 Type 11 methyltransferase [Magnetospirillum sp. UT-4]